MSSDDPLRLCDDPSMPSELRADLARALETPCVRVDMKKGLLRLSGVVAAGVVSAQVGAAEAVGASGAKASGLLAITKGAWWGLAVVGAAGVAAVGVASSGGPTSRTTALAASNASNVEAQAPTIVSTPSLAVPDPTAPATSDLNIASPRAADVGGAQGPVHAVARVPAHRPAPPAATSNDALAEETAHLVRLRALARSSPAAALAAAGEGNRTFPAGAFTEERESIAVHALVALGRSAEARARAVRFFTAFPQSPHCERLRRATGMTDPSGGTFAP